MSVNSSHGQLVKRGGIIRNDLPEVILKAVSTSTQQNVTDGIQYIKLYTRLLKITRKQRQTFKADYFLYNNKLCFTAL